MATEDFDLWPFIWLTVHFGVPFILLLLTCVWAMTHLHWRASHMKLWVLSQDERARFGLLSWLPDLHGYFDRLREWHAEYVAQQSPALLRNGSVGSVRASSSASSPRTTAASAAGVDEQRHRGNALAYFVRTHVPYLGLGFWGLIVAGPLIELAVWGALLIVQVRPVRVGVATVFIASAFIALGYAFFYLKCVVAFDLKYVRQIRPFPETADSI
jgi:hypothetical protein